MNKNENDLLFLLIAVVSSAIFGGCFLVRMLRREIEDGVALGKELLREKHLVLEVKAEVDRLRLAAEESDIARDTQVRKWSSKAHNLAVIANHLAREISEAEVDKF